MMHIIKHLLLLAVILVVSSCEPQKISGTYATTDNRNKIMLGKSTYSIVMRNPDNQEICYKCCDTVSFGTWTKLPEGNFLSLKSDVVFDNPLAQETAEHYTESLEDTLSITIDNPIEKHYEKFNEKLRELYYVIETSSTNADFDFSISLKKWETSKIKIIKPSGTVIKNIGLHILIKPDIPLRFIEKINIDVSPYNIEYAKSNNFNIAIRGLTYDYISFLRLNQDYIKIERGNLIWNNTKYIKQ